MLGFFVFFRFNKIERLFLDAISANNIEMLETIITDENAMFDVLGDFFYHVNRQGTATIYAKIATFFLRKV